MTTHAQFLYKQAAKCRRMARSIPDEKVAHQFEELAAEYEQRAREAEDGEEPAPKTMPH